MKRNRQLLSSSFSSAFSSSLILMPISERRMWVIYNEIHLFLYLAGILILFYFFLSRICSILCIQAFRSLLFFLFLLLPIFNITLGSLFLFILVTGPKYSSCSSFLFSFLTNFLVADFVPFSFPFNFPRIFHLCDFKFLFVSIAIPMSHQSISLFSNIVLFSAWYILRCATSSSIPSLFVIVLLKYSNDVTISNYCSLHIIVLIYDLFHLSPLFCFFLHSAQVQFLHFLILYCHYFLYLSRVIC